MLTLVDTKDDQLEHDINEAYQLMCNAQTDAEARRAMNQMYELIAQRSSEIIREMEAARMARIQKGG